MLREALKCQGLELIQDIIGTNLLTKFHDDRKINVTSRVKNFPPHVGHVFQPTGIIFKLVQDIIGMNLLRTINVASRVLTRFYYSHIRKNSSPLGSHFHEDRKINVASRVLTRQNAPPPGAIFFNQPASFWNLKNAPPLGSHVFQAKITIFELIQDIIGTNFLTKFHTDRKINVTSRVLIRKNAPPCGGHVFQPTGIILELVQDIIWMNLLTKFYEDQTINVASRVLTRFYYSHIRKNTPTLGSNVFQANITIFKLI
ncbi:hypothetical protein DPMN_126352 [Dreissena polymorpha]|uniref:Uncharacterized protein n=1 Tax=Dreissena polymorpha TaxID=45954 RepID=A0A9D4GWW4_DREPO|nr:hypothetical protein DPMN_126352 [Dreissena polymorpha]